MGKTFLSDKKTFEIIKDGLEDTVLITGYIEELLGEIAKQNENDFEKFSMLMYKLKSLELKINIINSVIASYEMSEKKEDIIPS